MCHSTKLDLDFDPNQMLLATVTTCDVWASNERVCAKQTALATQKQSAFRIYSPVCLCEWERMRHADAQTGGNRRKEGEKWAPMKGGLMSSRVSVCNESCEAEEQRALTSNCVSGWVSGRRIQHGLCDVMLRDLWKSSRRQKSDITVHLRRHFVLLFLTFLFRPSAFRPFLSVSSFLVRTVYTWCWTND